MMRKYLFTIGLMALLVSLVPIAPAHAVGMAKLVIKVVDEDGRPMEGARVSLYFQSGGLEKDRTVGLTDEEGLFSASGFSSNGMTGGGVNKDGYYQSVVHHDFYRKTLGMWQPWGKEFTVVMRPIVNPVPMYVRDKSFKLPATDKEIGFDLEKADWVIPYGLGTQSDFIFKVERRYDNNNNFDATMTLVFSNPFDGILVVKDDGGGDFNVGSWFRLPRTAPESGYQTKLERRRSRGSYGWYNDKNESDDNNYIFRVRSEVDENGKLKRAMYGKIRGDIRFSTGEVLKIGMHYYLNPDYTPNLEFDPKRNLFISLPSDENVRQP